MSRLSDPPPSDRLRSIKVMIFATLPALWNSYTATALLEVLVTWAAIVFAGWGLFAPRQAVTGTYARSTPEALEEAVNRLAEPRSNVIEFKRKAS